MIDHPLASLRQHLERGNVAAGLSLVLDQWQAVCDAVAAEKDAGQAAETLRLAAGSLWAEILQPHEQKSWGCPLLQVARHQPQGLAGLLERILHFQTRLRNSKCWLGVQTGFPALDVETTLPLTLVLRARALELNQNRDDDEDRNIRKKLSALLDAHQRALGTSTWRGFTGDDPVPRPAAWHVLDSTSSRLAHLLNDVVEATPQHWLDPAAVFLADTLVAAQGRSLNAAPNCHGDTTGRAWLLISLDDSMKLSTSPSGLLLLVRVERLKSDCGAFYPHPDHAGHLLVHESFQRSLRDAWLVVLGHLGPGDERRRHDYRLRIEVVDDSHQNIVPRRVEEDTEQTSSNSDIVWHRHRHWLSFVPLTGQSGSVPLAAALKSAAEQIPLGLHAAATGAFRDSPPKSSNPVLQTVGDVLQKEKGIDAALEAVTRSRNLSPIEEFVLVTGQSVTLRARRPIQYVSDFDSAFRLLSADALLTHRYHNAVLEQIRQWFREHCFAPDEPANDQDAIGAYLLNRLRHVSSQRDPIFADEAREHLVRGDVGLALSDASGGDNPRLVKIIADSGIGKTSFLVYCQHRITAEHGDRIAIRVEHLTTFLTGEDRDGLLKAAVAQLLTMIPRQSESEGNFRKRLHDWLDRKAQRAEVVWCLDALDQMSGHRERVVSLARAFPGCPVLLTLRPDADREFGSVIGDGQAIAWTSLELLPFTKEDAEHYLHPNGRLFSELIPQDQDSDNSGGVLTIPLLRRFALEHQLTAETARNLPELQNRHAVYRAVMSGKNGLVGKGYQSLAQREERVRETFEELSDAIDCVERIAWRQVQAHHFDTAVVGELYRKIRGDLREIFPQGKAVTAAKQLNVVTLLPTFDESAEGGFKWRHRSFLEYFAGCRLAKLFGDLATRDEAERVLRGMQSMDPEEPTHPQDFFGQGGLRCRNLPVEWSWTLRFALCEAKPGKVRDELAWTLICFGNPWMVYGSIRGDRLELSEDVATVCRWLVHRGGGLTDTRDAWKGRQPEPPVSAWVSAVSRLGCGGTPTERMTATLNDLLLNRWTRNGAYVHPLRELLVATVDGAIPDGTLRPLGTVCATAMSAYLSEADGLRTDDSVLAKYVSRFIPIPAGTIDPLSYDGQHNPKVLREAGVTGPIAIESGWHLSDFPVTNAELEAWCPTHRRWREQASDKDDEPAVSASWCMGVEFARWLTGTSGERRYKLPSEWLWEYACRWGTTTDYWWGKGMSNDLCCYVETSRRRTRGREAAIAAHAAAGVWHPSRESARAQGLELSPGLLDLHGNVWEWTAARYRANDSAVSAVRVLRGGSWFFAADFCRSSKRDGGDPVTRYDGDGFRLCWRSR